MTPDDWIRLAAYGSFFGGVATVIVLLVQLLAWPNDRQEVAGMAVVATTGAFIWRIWIAIAFGIAMKDNPSAILYVVMMAGWVWFMAETIAHNWGRFRRRMGHMGDHPLLSKCRRCKRS